MTIKAIIEMMDKLGFSNTAKHRVSYDLLESSMYIPVDREGSPLSKVLDMSITTDSVLDIKEELIKLKEDNIRRAKEMYAKTKRVPKNAIPVTYNGTHYRSKAECMACEDISSFQLERYLKNIDTKK